MVRATPRVAALAAACAALLLCVAPRGAAANVAPRAAVRQPQGAGGGVAESGALVAANRDGSRTVTLADSTVVTFFVDGSATAVDGEGNDVEGDVVVADQNDKTVVTLRDGTVVMSEQKIISVLDRNGNTIGITEVPPSLEDGNNSNFGGQPSNGAPSPSPSPPALDPNSPQVSPSAALEGAAEVPRTDESEGGSEKSNTTKVIGYVFGSLLFVVAAVGATACALAPGRASAANADTYTSAAGTGGATEATGIADDGAGASAGIAEADALAAAEAGTPS